MLPLLPTNGKHDSTLFKRVLESINGILRFDFDDSRNRTAAERANDIWPVNYAYRPGDVRRYGAVADDATDCTRAIQDALDTGGDVFLPGGTYRANNLTQSTSFQKISGEGWVRIKKNANGALFTSTGDDVELNGIGFDGNATGGFTGNNIVMSGENPRLINCGSRDTASRPLLATGNHVQVLGTCDIYSTTDATSSGYDIEIGVSGTATLYHVITGLKTSQAAGGFKFTDTGSPLVADCQFGKLTVVSGTSPAGVNGGSFKGNRILGDISCGLSNSEFAANAFGAITITLESGTSGHRFGTSNNFQSGCTLVDNSTESTFIDTRETTNKTYTPTWTGAVSNPAIGNGTLTGRYYLIGKLCFATIKLVCGSTTTYGSGAWSFSLPSTPATFGVQVGSARVLDSGTALFPGVAVTIGDGTAKVQATVGTASTDATANIDSGRPMTWAQNDELYLTITYLTN